MRKMKRKKLRLMCANLAPVPVDVGTVEAIDVWEVICNTPQEAADMRARTRLLYELIRTTEQRRWTLSEAAHHCGVTKEQMRAMQHGRVSRFTLVELQMMADRLRQGGDV